MARALRSLPAHYLDVILMRDFEELTIAEISSQLNVSVGAVKSRLHRARELIRESLISTEG
ncbi:RNA polymerase sigma factor, partial [Salmonella enterica]|uniref:RNA polymerase sigma factor n=1 Tax=Salmonella enterica TaxID=28901 RepID=UPI003D2F72AB